jgi:hypothetical protein
MLFKALSAAVFGIDAYPVEVEADISRSALSLVGVGRAFARRRVARRRLWAAGRRVMNAKGAQPATARRRVRGHFHRCLLSPGQSRGPQKRRSAPPTQPIS